MGFTGPMAMKKLFLASNAILMEQDQVPRLFFHVQAPIRLVLPKLISWKLARNAAVCARTLTITAGVAANLFR
jgi:hypothetical protein